MVSAFINGGLVKNKFLCGRKDIFENRSMRKAYFNQSPVVKAKHLDLSVSVGGKYSRLEFLVEKNNLKKSLPLGFINS